jgi:mannonate dehydratase
MKRRDLFQMAAASAAAAVTQSRPASAATAQKKPVLMKIGTQHSDDEKVLKVLASFGVKNICSALPSRNFDEKWTVDGLKRLREKVEACGIHLDAVPLPMSSAYITRHENPEIMLGKSPERDRQIDNICQMIRNCAQAGIPMVKYNMSILGVVRSESTPGRGYATYSTFNLSKAKQDPPLTEAGPVPADVFWERITYYVERVAPVALEYKVKMACHPHDPAMPKDVGFRGVHRVLGSPDGLKRLVSIKENPYHGINFCQGTVSEMLEKPGEQIFDVIRYFGSRKKIFNVHFRNIRGGFLNFQETFPDDGDVNLVKAARTYQEVGYDGMLMPDHVPRIPGDEGGHQAFAFAFGYIQAVLQMIRMEQES